MTNPETVDTVATGTVGVVASAGSVITSLMVMDEVLRTATLVAGLVVACLTIWKLARQLRRRRKP